MNVKLITKTVKKKSRQIACILCVASLLGGCSLLPDISDSNTVENTEYVTVGNHLTVHNTDSRLTLYSNMDALSADGLYYASWTSGDPEPYENSDGDTVDLYEAQLYLLLGEFKTSDAAQENMNSWLDAGQTNYDVTDEQTVTYNEQTYTVITYNSVNEENPYSHGISAFGVYNNLAVCAELTCQEDYREDLNEVLTIFLNNCTYD